MSATTGFGNLRGAVGLVGILGELPGTGYGAGRKRNGGENIEDDILEANRLKRNSDDSAQQGGRRSKSAYILAREDRQMLGVTVV